MEISGLENQPLAANNDNPRAKKAPEPDRDEAKLKTDARDSPRSEPSKARRPDGVGNQVDRRA